MEVLRFFKSDESGAVTVDWVVITSAIVGISIAVIMLISGGVNEASNSILNSLKTDWSFNFSTRDATSYFDFGIAAYPDDQTAAWKAARLEVHNDAPTGYEYDPELTVTRYVDTASGDPIYVSEDGTTYSIGGDIVSANEYDTSGRTTFKSTFDQYWTENQ